MFSCLSILDKSVLIVALAAGLLTQFFPCCAFAIRSFSKVSATPAKGDFIDKPICFLLVFLCFKVIFACNLEELEMLESNPAVPIQVTPLI